MKLPRTLRLDASDALMYAPAAEPGEWAIPGGFAFADDTEDTLAGKRRQAFRAGFLGLTSFGWSTLVEVAEATPADRTTALAALATHLETTYGAPSRAEAEAAAAEELAFAASLCDHPVGTVLALERTLEDGALRERFRTLHLRAREHRDFGALPVFNIVTVEGEDAPERPDLTRLGERP
ncbi:DUF6505 family protein [Plastoroseomonas arctica]|uniref:Uncharacterized protein n=1 Tax=Plastoroseomonas arctica TaxID=1509237 RepID=A0AAF1KN78_9PROT|nr:DUF6505 family protein [Plastoroseomonas arctica]MBR0654223.1 hypothetical protein [Plastoroseomonas arctica]